MSASNVVHIEAHKTQPEFSRSLQSSLSTKQINSESGDLSGIPPQHVLIGARDNAVFTGGKLAP